MRKILPFTPVRGKHQRTLETKALFLAANVTLSLSGAGSCLAPQGLKVRLHKGKVAIKPATVSRYSARTEGARLKERPRAHAAGAEMQAELVGFWAGGGRCEGFPVTKKAKITPALRRYEQKPATFTVRFGRVINFRGMENGNAVFP
jgi:hypothetical protein